MNMNDEFLHQSRMNAAIQAEEYNLVALLRPRIFIDGNQWCVLHGENLQDGVAGFGDTPYLAVLAFGREWHKPLALASMEAAQTMEMSEAGRAALAQNRETT